jgi:hypothetical protein
MRISGSRVLAAALVLGISTVSFAQTKSEKSKAPEKPAAPASAPSMPPGFMQPAPELAKIKWMAGTWQCTGKAMASPMGPEHPTEAEVKSEEVLGGVWILFHYREKKTAQNPMPILGEEYWTYDASGKTWNRVVLDNTGSWGSATSNGWEKGKLVWSGEGVMGGQKRKFRDTFTEKSPQEIDYVGEMAGADNKLRKLWEVNCKK